MLSGRNGFAASLIVLAAMQAHAQTATIAGADKLPVEARAVVDKAVAGCGRKASSEDGFITRRDVNGDGIDDYILDYTHFHCTEGHDTFCGSGGCLTQVFASLPGGRFVQVLDLPVEAIDFKRVHGRPAMLLDLHGLFCGKGGAEACNMTFYWNGKKFDRRKG